MHNPSAPYGYMSRSTVAPKDQERNRSAEQHIKYCIAQAQSETLRCNYESALSHLKKAKTTALSISNPADISQKDYIRQDYFNLSITILTNQAAAFTQRKVIMSLQYAQRLIDDALNGKTLSNWNYDALKISMIGALQENWVFFDRKSESEFARVFELIVASIRINLRATNLKKPMWPTIQNGLFRTKHVDLYLLDPKETTREVIALIQQHRSPTPTIPIQVPIFSAVGTLSRSSSIFKPPSAPPAPVEVVRAVEVAVEETEAAPDAVIVAGAQQSQDYRRTHKA